MSFYMLFRSYVVDSCLFEFMLLVSSVDSCLLVCFFFFFQAEDGIRDLVRSRGLGDVYKRQVVVNPDSGSPVRCHWNRPGGAPPALAVADDLADRCQSAACLLYTSDAADERSSVDLGGRRIIKKKNHRTLDVQQVLQRTNRSLK